MSAAEISTHAGAAALLQVPQQKTAVPQSTTMADREISTSYTGQARRDRTLPVLHIPDEQFMKVEHPCLVKNIDRGIQSLGGEQCIEEALDNQDFRRKLAAEGSMRLSLYPVDPLAQTVPNFMVKGNEILVKVTVPKRTGRKRKRGSDGPWIQDEDHQEAVLNSEPIVVLRSMRDHAGRYTLTPMGYVVANHRFRTVPDFQYATTDNPLMNEFRSHVLPLRNDNLKAFNLDLFRGIRDGTDIGPPPAFSAIDVPFGWDYRQDTNTQFVGDHRTGEVNAVNIRQRESNILFYININAKELPTGPPPDIIPEDQQDEDVQESIRILREMLEERPIMSRRYIQFHIPARLEYWYHFAQKYVGYGFRKGPWRDCLIKYGIDPRSDPKYRMYQVLYFKVPKRKSSRPRESIYSRSRARVAKDKRSYKFDGTKVSLDGKIWQVLDVEDPLLKGLLHDKDGVRQTPHVRERGWYKNALWAKARVIMKYKIEDLVRGARPDDEEYNALVEMPNDMTQENQHLFSFTKERVGGPNARTRETAALVRQLCKGILNKLPRRADEDSEWSDDQLGDEGLEDDDVNEDEESNTEGSEDEDLDVEFDGGVNGDDDDDSHVDLDSGADVDGELEELEDEDSDDDEPEDERARRVCRGCGSFTEQDVREDSRQ